MLRRPGLLEQGLPALLLLGLLLATQPAAARGPWLLCTQAGSRGVPGDDGPPGPDERGKACLHGWCPTAKRRKL